MLWNRSNDFLKLFLTMVCACALLQRPCSAADGEASAENDAARTQLERFISQASANGFADFAMYRMEQLKADGELPKTFEPVYLFQMAVVTEASAGLARKNEDRLERHDSAIQFLDQYIKEQPNGEYYYPAIGFLPNIRLNKSLVYSAIGNMGDPSDEDTSKYTAEEKADWEKRSKDFAEKKKKNEELARGELVKNVEFLTAQEKKILEDAKKLNADNEDENKKRTEMLGELNNLRMARGNTFYELSKTYLDGKEKMEWLGKARDQYKFFWDKYAENGFLIAYRGRVNEAKMLIEMKKFSGKGEAIEILGDLYSGLKESVSREGLRDVYVEVCTCYFNIFADAGSDLKPNDDQKLILKEAIQSFDPSKAGSILRSYSMEKTPVGVQMRLAYIKYMEHYMELNKADLKNASVMKEILRKDVRSLYALPPNPYLNEIRALHERFFPEEHAGDAETNYTFANYRKELKKKQVENLKKPADKRENLYLDVRKFALKEFSNYFKARMELNAWDDAAKAKEMKPEEAKAKKAELQQAVAENPAKLVEVYELLESLKSYVLKQNQIDILVLDRFYRSQVLYFSGRQYEAVTMLDYIVTRYSSAMQASNALYYELAYLNGLVVNEYRELKKQMQSGNADITQAQITEMFRGELELLATRIEMKAAMLAEPDKYALNETDDSGNPIPKPIKKDEMSFEWERLCKLCLMVGAVDMAQEYIIKIPEESENRAALELSIGFSLWNMYIEFKRADDEHKPFSLKQADEYQKLALSLLESGAQKLKKQVKSADDVTSTVLAAAMTLCESYSRRGDNKNAIQWLRDEKIGPYKLLCENHPTVTDDRKDRILNIALVAFVSENDMESAFDAMDRLEKLAAEGTDGDMDEKLTKKYMSLGVQLRDNLQSMVASGDAETLKQVKVVQCGFEEFLKRISERENGTSYSSLNWIAQTFLSLAEGSQESGAAAKVNDDTRKYYESAVETYKNMLERMKSDKDFIPDATEETLKNRTVLLQRKIAETYEALGDYENADAYYRMVAAAKPGYMELQYRILNMYVSWSRSVTDDMKLKGNLLVQANAGLKKTEGKGTLFGGWSAVIRRHNDFILVGSDPQKRWMYYYATLKEAEVNFLYGLAKGGYKDETGKKAIDRAFNAIKKVYDAGTDSDDDFGGSVQKLDADGMATGEFFEKDGLKYEPLEPLYEALLKRVQEVRGEEATGFANWKREVVEETPVDADAFSDAEIEDNDQVVELENKRLAAEEDFARKMMTPKAAPTPEYVKYAIYGGAGLIFLILLILIMRGGSSKSAKRRKELLAAVKVPADASGFQAAPAADAPVTLGIGEEVVDSSAAAGALASLGIGDAPVPVDEPKEEAAPAFSFDFGAPSAPAAEKPAVKKVVKKAPAPAAASSEPAPAAHPAVKKVVKKAVHSEKPAEKPAEAPAEKPAVKKVIKLVKKPTEKDSE